MTHPIQPGWRQTQRDWLLPILSGWLMILSFSPWEPFQGSHQFSFVAWFAWVPWCSLLLPQNPDACCRNPFRSGYLAGLFFWLGTIYWIHHTTIPGMLMLAAFLSLYFGLWGLIMARFHLRWQKISGGQHILLATLGAASWVALEWGKGWILGGFPWNDAGTTQYRNLALIQIAQWTGKFWISFLVVFFNLSLWLTWRRLRHQNFSLRSWRYEFSLAVLLVTGTLVAGMRMLLAAPREQSGGIPLKVALIQPNIPQDIKYEVYSRAEQESCLEQLTMNAALLKPDLIMWPETALVTGPNLDPRRGLWMLDLVKRVQTPILFGAMDADAGGDADSKPQQNYYNTALLATRDLELAPGYHKMHLVPFGEYVPFERWMPWLRWLTPIEGSFTPGEVPVWFTIKGIKIGPLICFEDTFPGLSRTMVKGGADLLVNLTNDAWFLDSPGASLHAANAVLRAVENRRPLIRCTNSGYTCIIGSRGEIHCVEDPATRGFRLASVNAPAGQPLTFYTRFGDWFAFLCAATAGLGLFFAGSAAGPARN
ncbi:MAG: apolipoprotein N-acyltransferase [Verrucomicrobiae bacterium]|nr:apolipoprotein N-acyltransferase [Verrucomicrobiae bacterium]